MKNFIAKLKSGGFKNLLIEHGEKLAAGVVGLLLLFALLAANWSKYGDMSESERTPAQLTDKVEKADKAIAAQTWTNSEDAKEGKYTVNAGLTKDEVELLLTNDETKRLALVGEGQAKYVYSTPIFETLYRGNEPARMPDLLAPEEPIASVGQAFIPKMQVLAAVDPDSTDVAAADAGDDGERKIRSSFATGSSGAGGGIYDGEQGIAMDQGGVYMGQNESYGGEMGTMGGGAVTHADGYRFVSVRAIVPLQRQIESFVEALHVQPREARLLVDYWDFELERRSKPGGSPRDFGDWEKVDIRTAEDIMREAAGWDPELIELSLTDPVLTMALPTRVLYNWIKEEASHPRLENFVLSESQRDLQMMTYGSYIDHHIEMTQESQKFQKKGFARQQQGNRTLLGQETSNGSMNSSANQMLISRIAQSIDRDNPDKIREELLKQIMRSQTAAGRLLLFRYIDFDVKPGTTYQYRVRVVLENPNFEKPQQLVIDPEITTERLLATPFSQATAPVTVPRDVNYYVTNVDTRDAGVPSARFDVYMWSTVYGSTIHKEYGVRFGEFIGKRETADVADVAIRQYLEGEEVDFKSDDVLVDALDSPKPIDLELHPDLKGLPQDKRLNGLGVARQALLVDDEGELKAIDPVTLAASYAKVTGDYKNHVKNVIDPIKESGAGAAAEGDFIAYENMYGGAEGEAAGGRRGSRKGGGNKLRRGSRASGGTPMGP